MESSSCELNIKEKKKIKSSSQYKFKEQFAMAIAFLVRLVEVK